METLTYVCKERHANAVRFEVPLISVKAHAFGDDVPALMSSHRRILCMNVKQSNRLRVLNRQGKYAETDVRAPVLRQLVSSEGHLDHCAFFAVGGEEVSRLKPVNHANGEIQILLREVNLREELYGVAVGSGDIAYALGKAHIFEVDMETATKKAVMDLASKTVVRYPVIAYHHEAKLLLAPAKQNCLDLISTNTRKSILPKVWEPHGGLVPTTAFFVQFHAFENESAGNIFIVTAACGNTELRLWCYNTTKQTFSLMQDLCISVESVAETTSAANEKEEFFLVSYTPTEEYITLCSRRHPLAVVVELHQNNFKIDRITSWKLQGPVLSSVAMVGKVAESALSGSVGYQLMLAVRTASGFYEEVLDVEKLVGASNTAAIKQNSVAAWFPDNETEVSVMATGLPTALTAVSSSVLGDKTTNAVSQAMASRIVRQQASQFCDKLRSIDERVVDLQKRASEVMRLFQEARAREEAQTIGRKFAARNKGRLELQQPQAQSPKAESPDTLNASQQNFLDQIHSMLDEVDAAAAESAQETVKVLLTQRLKDAVAKGAKEAEQTDLGIVAPTIRSTDSMQVFSNAIDSAMRLLVRAIKDHHAMMQSPLKASITASTECATKAKEFGASLKNEMQKLLDEINETKKAVSQMNVTAVQVDPDVLVSRAVAAAEANDWSTAFTIALEASDITVLLGFLEHKVCMDNMSTIVRPQKISLPTFLSLCLQLSFELDTQPGSIPLRIQLLHLFYVEWDDALKEIKQKATGNASQEKLMFELTKREIHNVLEQLALVEDHSLDRRSRNQLRLLKKLMNSFLAEA
ncbi:hypothetical protein ECC02_006476 [Trypanosoma cruzi]|uniref:Uncharacterized protein n=1 Tax=Trypanosoma cruzi TaxID=5693 RepID=A0A7J6Y1G3_TRYCR|nr:hypothetical protein ECC02_006476 [Trypanosoma cruzi]